MKKLLSIFPLLMTLAYPSFAAQDFYEFSSPAQQQRFESLTNHLRCLVCQNQTLAESNAPLATDLRDQIYQQVQHGQSNQQIIDYLVARYGDFILYQPPLNTLTLGLWFGPFLILIAGLSYLLYYLKKSKRV
jgi:cytochrome c-type biogenesis protein CcmH